MKKFATLFTAIVLTAFAAMSLTACGKKEAKVKIIEIGLSNEQYGIAIQKGNTDLKASIDAIISELTGGGVEYNGSTVTFQSLYDAEKAANSDLSIGSVQTVSSDRANELVVATNAEFPPFEYMIGNSFGGVDMQIAKLLADKLGKTLVVKHMDFNVVTQAVSSGSADIALAGLTISDDRKEVVDFSLPYYDTTQYIAVSADDASFDACTTAEEVEAVLQSLAAGTKAGAAKAQTGYYYLAGNADFEFDGLANLDVKMYATVAMAVQDLAGGTVKLVCGDKDTLSAAVKAVNG